jgi:hypothetical protein
MHHTTRLTSLLILTLLFAVLAASCSLGLFGSSEPVTVNYFANGADSGTPPTDARTYESGQELVVQDNTGNLRKSGFTFAGWNTEEDGSGYFYSPGDTLIVDSSNILLFARWRKLESATVTGSVYYSQTTIPISGVTVTVEEESYTTDDTGTYELSAVPTGDRVIQATKSGYDSYTRTILIGDRNSVHDIELTGGEVFNLTGTISDDTGSNIAGATITVLNPDGSESGLSDTTDDTGNYQIPIVPQGQREIRYDHEGYPSTTRSVYSAGADREFNVQLPRYPYMTYDGTQAVAGEEPVDPDSYLANAYKEGTAVTVAGPGTLVGPTVDGLEYVLGEWNTAVDGTGDSYRPGDTFVVGPSNTTLYAQWTVIGARGPAGGIVFHDTGSDTGGRRYLEAAPYDVRYNAQWWYDLETDVENTTEGAPELSAIGTGAANTEAIVAGLGVGNSNRYAAKECYDFEYGGFDDWFLPSIHELAEMCRHRKTIGNFALDYYWSSTEDSSEPDKIAWCQGFGVWGSEATRATKDQRIHVRPIRAF